MENTYNTINDSHSFTGTHVLGELYGISVEYLDSVDMLIDILDKGIEMSSATKEGTLVKKFQPQGVSVVVLLSESHVSIHTYPEFKALFVDAFTCGVKCNPRKIVDMLISELNPIKINVNTITRGEVKN